MSDSNLNWMDPANTSSNTPQPNVTPNFSSEKSTSSLDWMKPSVVSSVLNKETPKDVPFETKYSDLVDVAKKKDENGNSLDISFLKNDYKSLEQYFQQSENKFSSSAPNMFNQVNSNMYKHKDLYNIYAEAKKANAEFLKNYRNPEKDNKELYANAYAANKMLQVYLSPTSTNNPTNYVYNEETNQLEDKTAFFKTYDKPVYKLDEKGNRISSSTLDSDLSGNFDFKSTNSSYLALKSHEDYIFDSFKPEAKKLMSSWTDTSLKLITRYSKDSDNLDLDDLNNVEKSYSLFTDILNHTSKYGTVGEQKKDLAIDLVNQLSKIKDPKEKYSFIANHKDDILSISNNLGFYGTKAMYSKYKDVITDPEFYNKEKPNRDYLDSLIELHDDFKKVDYDARKQAKDLMTSENLEFKINEYLNLDKNELINNFLSSDLKINSFNEFKKNMLKNLPDWAKQDYDYSADMSDAEYSVRRGISNLTSLITGEQSLGDSKSEIDSQLQEAYSKLSSFYKAKFDNVSKQNSEFINSRMAIGFGQLSANVPMYAGLDFTEKNSTSGTNKFKRMNNVVNLVNQLDGNRQLYVTDENINFKLNNFKTSNDSWFGEDMYREDDKNNLGAADLNTFLKNASNNVSASYYAYPTGSKQFSAYVFKDEESGKEMAVFLPKKKLEEIEDPFEIASKYKTRDFVYDYIGEKQLYNLPAKQFKNAKVVASNNGGYEGHVLVPLEEAPGAYEKKVINLGSANSLTWSDAESLFQNMLERYINAKTNF